MSSLTAKVPKTTQFFWVTSLVLLLSSDLAAGQPMKPHVDLLEATPTVLKVRIDLGCTGDPGSLTSLKIEQRTGSEQGVHFGTVERAVSEGAQQVVQVLSGTDIGQMCDALDQVPAKVEVKLLLTAVGVCGGEEHSFTYPLVFTLLCGGDGGTSEIHAPSTTDPGPPAPSAPEATDSLQIEGVWADGSGGASVAYEQAFGEYDRQLLRVSAGIREPSETVPLRPSDFPGPFTDETRIETDLKLVPVDVSYGLRWLPPDRRVVSTVYAGAGYVFADADVPTLEGGELGDVLRPDLDALMGRDESGFTLNAGVSVRFNLRPGSRGKYLYLGARTRWYAKRDADRTDEEVFFGLGLPVCKGGRRYR